MPTRRQSRRSRDEALQFIREMRTIEMFQDEEDFMRRTVTEVSNAIEQSTNEMLQIVRGTHPRYRRVIQSLREGPRPVGLGGWTDRRLLTVVDEIDRLAREVEIATGDRMLRGSSNVYADVYQNYPDILSFGNRIPNFSSSELTMSQIRSLVEDTPVGGNNLRRFLDRVFNDYTQEDIRNEMLVGAMQGEGIPKLTSRIKDKYQWLDQPQIDRIVNQAARRGLEGSQLDSFIAKKTERVIRQNAITTVRTHMQSAASNAMDRVYSQNMDIINTFEWNSTMEPGYTTSGRGTCPRCAALDGEVYESLEDMPEVPLHPNCRCVRLPVTKSWRELGLKREGVDEIINDYRPYAIRESDAQIVEGKGKSIGVGGRRILGSVGRGPNRSYSEWFEDRNNFFKMNVVGPSRANWLAQDSRRTLNDLVDRRTGRLLRVEELPGETEILTRSEYIDRHGTRDERRQLADS